MPITYITENIEEITTTDLLAFSQTLTKEIAVDSIFKLKDLFPAFIWKQIPKSKRLSLGILYMDWSKSNDGNLLVKDAGKTKSNQQKYCRI